MKKDLVKRKLLERADWQERHLSEEELTSDRNTQIRRVARSFTPNPMSLELAKKKSKKKGRRTALVSGVLIFAAAVILCAVCFQVFFKLDHIIVKNCTKYNEKQVFEGSGLVLNDNLYQTDYETIQKNIDKNLPYIAGAKITRIWPSVIEINVTETEETAFIEFGGNYYILSERLRVLEKTTDIERIESQNLMRVYFGDISQCIVGQYLKLVDKDSFYSTIEILDNLKKVKILNLCSELDLRNKFDIRFLYLSRYKVKLGDGHDTDIKIDFMKAISKQLYEEETGTIDVSDKNLKEGIVIRDS